MFLLHNFGWCFANPVHSEFLRLLSWYWDLLTPPHYENQTSYMKRPQLSARHQFFFCCHNWHKKTKKNISGQARLERLERPDLCIIIESFLRQCFLFLVLVSCYQKGIRSRTTVVIKWYCSFVFKGKSRTFIFRLFTVASNRDDPKIELFFLIIYFFSQHNLELHAFSCSQKKDILISCWNQIWNQYLFLMKWMSLHTLKLKPMFWNSF